MNVSALCEVLELAQPTVSHHLGLLREARLVRTRREGKQVHYALNSDHIVAAEDGTLRISTPTAKVSLNLPPDERRSSVLAACG
jgi:ArsR family transcriptional regulator